MLGRFAAYGWHTQRVEDGTDVEAIDRAIDAAEADDRPSIIAVRTHIGYGSPNKQDTQKAHGSPLGPDEVRLTKEAYGWDPDKTFFVPDDALALFRRAVDQGRERVEAWESRLDAYADAFPAEAAELKRRLAGRLADGWDDGLPVYETGTEVATRNASQDAIQALAGPVPELFGGSADLSESNLTDVKANGHDHFEADHPGRNLRFGVREHGMGSISNGIEYHGGFLPYCATFLTFSDYMRGAVRLAALSELHVSTSGPTTRWAWARTGRPTSRSSTTRRSARSPTCGSSARATPTRRWPRGRSRWSGRRSRARRAGRPRPHAAEAADPARAPRRWRARACGAAGTCCARPAAASPPS